MKITFVAFGVESYSIEILSSYLKSRGHQTSLVFDPCLFQTEIFFQNQLAKFFTSNLVDKIVAEKPDFIGFSLFTLNYQRALSLASQIKKHLPNTPVIFGGIHPTSVPQEVINQPQVDIVCRGEGEYALAELLDNPSSTSIKNLWFKNGGQIIKNPLRPLISDLDSLPLPDKKLFFDVYPGFLTDYYTTTSRGCPFGCTFCANNVLNKIQQGLGPPLRRRSPQNVIKELVWAKKNFPIKRITFVDDIFVQNPKWLQIFAADYQKYIRLPYVALTHPSFITPKTAKLLKQSGCYFLLLGLQSASEKIRSQVLKRFETNHQIKQAAKYCHQNHLNFSIDHILNIPGETINDYVFALKFYKSLKPSIINCFYLQYFPQTEIINIAKLKKPIIKKINQGKTSTSLVVGFGNQNLADPQLLYSNFQFFFLLVPILPQKIINLIIQKKLYLKKFHPPLFVNALIKILLSTRVGRLNVYWGIIKQTLYFLFHQ